MEQVGFIHWHPAPESTENETNNAPFLGKCEVCGDMHLILTVGQCGKG